MEEQLPPKVFEALVALAKFIIWSRQEKVLSIVSLHLLMIGGKMWLD